MSAMAESSQGNVFEHGFRLGGLTVAPAVGEIAGPAGLERVDPKVMRVFCVLAMHAGELVSREQLLTEVWARVAVTDDAVSRCIYQLRQHLVRATGESTAKQLIETLPKRGYRLAAVIEPLDAPTPTLAALAPRPPSRARPSIAVVLAVVLATGAVSWALGTTLAGRTSTSQPSTTAAARESDAHVEYVQGRFFYDRRGPGDLRRAESHFRRTVAIDPQHARAWAGLAAIHYHGMFRDPQHDHLTPMREAIDRALAADPDDPEVILRAARYFDLVGKRDIAQQKLQRALSLGSDDPLMLSVAAGDALEQGRVEEAVALQRRAAKGDPLGAIYRMNLVHMLIAAGDAPAARAELLRLKELSPSSVKAYDRALVAVAAGRHEEALTIIDATPDMDLRERDHVLAIAGSAAGRDAEAIRALEALRSDTHWLSSVRAADVYLRQGDIDDAFSLLDTAYDAALAENPALTGILRASVTELPHAARLRPDPRFRDLLARLDESERHHSRLASRGLEPASRDSR